MSLLRLGRISFSLGRGHSDFQHVDQSALERVCTVAGWSFYLQSHHKFIIF
jgi:hypothetical protein